MIHGQENISNEIYMLIKYIKSVFWRVAKRLSYTEDARCLKVKHVHVPQLKDLLTAVSNTNDFEGILMSAVV